MEQGKKKRRILWILGLLLLLLLTVVVGLWLGGRQGMKKNLAAELPAEEAGADLPAQEESIIYEGKRYRYNADLITALFMGIDQSIPEEGGTDVRKQYRDPLRLRRRELPQSRQSRFCRDRVRQA